MKLFFRLLFSLLIFLKFSYKTIGQEFIHDSITISFHEKEATLFYGLTTSEELKTLFHDSRSKTKLNTSGKGKEKSYTLTRRVRLSDGKTSLYFSAFGPDEATLEKELVLESITLKSGSQAVLDNNTWFLKSRESLTSEIGVPVKEKKSKTYYYPATGLLISYQTKSSLAMPKKITYYESPEIADKNFQIYLKWKGTQQE